MASDPQGANSHLQGPIRYSMYNGLSSLQLPGVCSNIYRPFGLHRSVGSELPYFPRREPQGLPEHRGTSNELGAENHFVKPVILRSASAQCSTNGGAARRDDAPGKPNGPGGGHGAIRPDSPSHVQEAGRGRRMPALTDENTAAGAGPATTIQSDMGAAAWRYHDTDATRSAKQAPDGHPERIGGSDSDSPIGVAAAGAGPASAQSLALAPRTRYPFLGKWANSPPMLRGAISFVRRSNEKPNAFVHQHAGGLRH